MKLKYCFRTPDSLKNLAWLTIRRHAMLFGGNMPNYGLKSVFASETKSINYNFRSKAKIASSISAFRQELSFKKSRKLRRKVISK